MEPSRRKGRDIPVHGGEEIGPPLFNKILQQLGITLDEFQKFR